MVTKTFGLLCHLPVSWLPAATIPVCLACTITDTEPKFHFAITIPGLQLSDQVIYAADQNAQEAPASILSLCGIIYTHLAMQQEVAATCQFLFSWLIAGLQNADSGSTVQRSVELY